MSRITWLLTLHWVNGINENKIEYTEIGKKGGNYYHLRMIYFTLEKFMRIKVQYNTKHKNNLGKSF